MKSVLALGCVSVIALVACAPTHSGTASAQPSAAPAARSASAAPPTGAPEVGSAGSALPVSSNMTAATAAGTSGPSASPSASLSADPDAIATSGPSESASEQKTAEPVPTPTEIPYVAADAPPQILTFSISSTTVHPGDVLSGSVTASSNVASVEVRVAGYSYNMLKTAPGIFSLAVTVPSVPRMFRRTYPLVAIARNTRGDATQRTTQITIR